MEEDLSAACVGKHVRAREGGRGMEVGRRSILSGGDKSVNKTQELLGVQRSDAHVMNGEI